MAAALVFGGTGLMGLVRLWRGRRDMLLFVLGLLAMTILVPMIRSAGIGSLAFSTRYTFIANIAMLLLVASGLSGMRKRMCVAAALGILALDTVSLGQFRWSYVTRSTGREVAARLRAEVQEGEALLFPSPIDAIRAQYYGDGCFANAFTLGPTDDCAGSMPPDATWLDVVAGMQRPKTFFTAAQRERLRSFNVVWVVDIFNTAATPPVLGSDYELIRTTQLLPGGQFGAERPLRLAGFHRRAAS